MKSSVRGSRSSGGGEWQRYNGGIPESSIARELPFQGSSSQRDYSSRGGRSSRSPSLMRSRSSRSPSVSQRSESATGTMDGEWVRGEPSERGLTRSWTAPAHHRTMSIGSSGHDSSLRSPRQRSPASSVQGHEMDYQDHGMKSPSRSPRKINQGTQTKSAFQSRNATHLSANWDPDVVSNGHGRRIERRQTAGDLHYGANAGGDNANPFNDQVGWAGQHSGYNSYFVWND